MIDCNTVTCPDCNVVLNKCECWMEDEEEEGEQQVGDEIFRKGEMNQRMGMGLMKLIYKRKEDKVELKNYRPITMLNTDLANRLKEVMPSIIETNQAYSIKGRDIVDTTMSIKYTIIYIVEKKDRWFYN